MIRYTEIPADDGEFIRLTIKALVAQGAPSTQPNLGLGYGPGVMCAYRGSEGLACAVGFWLSDDEAALCGERSAECVFDDGDHKRVRVFDRFADNPVVLIGLQEFHDYASNVYERNLSRGMEPRRAWYDALYTQVGPDMPYEKLLTDAIREYERENAK